MPSEITVEVKSRTIFRARLYAVLSHQENKEYAIKEGKPEFEEDRGRG